MSMLLMVQAMNIKVGNPLRKLVLLKLADNANDHGECWPSYQHIADQCEIGKSSVLRHIDALIQAGLLVKEIRPGGPKGNHSNIYQLRLGSVSLTPGVVSERNQGSVSLTPGGGVTVTPRTSHSFEPVIEPISLEPSCDGSPERSVEYPADFEAMWAKYPKRAGGNPKKSAFKAWKARRREGVPALDLEKAAEHYAAELRLSRKLGTEYVKQAATFFGPDEHWRDALASGVQEMHSGFNGLAADQFYHPDDNHLPAAQRRVLSRETHDPATGYALSYLRMRGQL